MEDLFYFTKSIVGLEEIRAIALEHQLRSEYVMEDLLNVYVEGEFLTVSHQSAGTEISTPHSEYWAWMPLHWTGGEDNGLDPNNQAVLDRYVPASELMVSLHLPTLKQLSIFLHALLEKYGGWIGLDLNWVDDEGNSINVFTIDTVRDLPLVFD